MHGIWPKVFRQPLGRFKFPHGFPEDVYRKYHICEDNSANPKLIHSDFTTDFSRIQGNCWCFS